MEFLINQTRGRYSGQENLEKNGSPRERKISPQKTSSFKGEKRRHQSWLQRQLSIENSEGYDSNGNDQAAAVAAAAYAITSLNKEPSIPIQKKLREGPPEPSITPTNSKKEGKKTVTIMEPGEGSTRQPKSHLVTTVTEIVPEDDGVPQDDGVPMKASKPTPSLKKTPSFPSMKRAPTFPEEPAPLESNPSFADKQLNAADPTFPEEPAPIERITSSADKQLNAANEIPEWVGAQKTDSPALKPKWEEPKLALPTTIKPATELKPPKLDLPPPPTMERQSSTITPAEGESEADAWQTAEMDKIKKKYEELNTRINNWENDKKKKARRQQDKSESELERTKLKALIKFRRQMEDISQIAEGARAKAAEGQRNEELKLKEKANKITRTGKAPRTCFCF